MSSLADTQTVARSKWVLTGFTLLGAGFVVFLDWTSKTLVRNSGLFWVENPYARSPLGMILIASFAGIVVWFARSRIVALGIGMAAGAALGNMLEMAFWGHATDWIPMLGGHANLADMVILIVPPVTMIAYFYRYQDQYSRGIVWKSILVSLVLFALCLVRLAYFSDQIGQPAFGGLFGS